ncbi:MAG: carbohydrate kinase family protein [Armatimonadota bacterium]|nr:MAG: carbohydrate kinase family protein [Armatimonadota bacterium]
MDKRDFDLLVLGDINVDIILSGMSSIPGPGTEELASDLDFRSGGSAANCARAAAKLGLAVAFVGLVGGDRFGDYLLQVMRESDVNVDYVRRSSEVKTGITVSLSLAADRAFATYSGSVAEFSLEHVDFSAFARARHLHIGGYFLQTRMKGGHRAVLEAAKQAGLTTSLDVGWDPQQRWNGDLPGALQLVDVLLPNEDEVMRLAGEEHLGAAAASLTRTLPTLAVKLGADGALGRQGDAEVRAPAFPVRVFDTTALGDCFNAGFLAAHLEGRDLEACLHVGNAAAAVAASRMGDDRYATRDEVERLLGAA